MKIFVYTSNRGSDCACPDCCKPLIGLYFWLSVSLRTRCIPRAHLHLMAAVAQGPSSAQLSETLAHRRTWQVSPKTGSVSLRHSRFTKGAGPTQRLLHSFQNKKRIRTSTNHHRHHWTFNCAVHFDTIPYDTIRLPHIKQEEHNGENGQHATASPGGHDHRQSQPSTLPARQEATAATYRAEWSRRWIIAAAEAGGATWACGTAEDCCCRFPFPDLGGWD